jgi:hypothetical protein
MKIDELQSLFPNIHIQKGLKQFTVVSGEMLDFQGVSLVKMSITDKIFELQIN